MTAPPATAAAADAPPAPGDGYVQSFARGLGVIRSFSADAPRQTITQVAAATALTRAGARRVLLETNHTLASAVHLYETSGFRHLAADEHAPSPYVRADVAMVLDLTD